MVPSLLMSFGARLMSPKTLVFAALIAIATGVGWAGYKVVNSVADMREMVVASREEMERLIAEINTYQLELERIESALKVAEEVRRQADLDAEHYRELDAEIGAAREKNDGEVAPVLRGTLDALGRLR